ncbi:cytochrome b pre-mRNA-processing protein 3 [Hoeflea marina]|uniref:Cytochrome b pre-mRNA-processing protein 3 n=1 Tax=Hoeflea marina TaxID=274592 RepID=A0A317PRR9_9HYPH|nr:ubiquinol-cytochrome C chaperone family protein [Hoeflea marina]PWW03435.1 cytochrome b pre-mRNA-processing protein 3 [Hoeflea marina]
MIFSLFKRKKANAAVVGRQYQALTDAARDPGFYTAMNVPDTVLGRFEMVCIHMVLYFRRTRAAGEAVEQLSQDIVDAFFEDIDHSIRELGIGDTGVPKRMKTLARMFYGRGKSYGDALDASNRAGLAEALLRNIRPDSAAAGAQDAASMLPLADYMIRADTALGKVTDATLAAGLVVFPAASNAEA